MLVEKRKNLIRLTSFVLILALIFSIPMLGQSGNVYAEGESATSASVEKSAKKEEIVTPTGVDSKKTEPDTEKSKDKKDSDKQAKASDPAAFIFDISEGGIVIGDGTDAGTLKVSYGVQNVIDNIDASQIITVIGSTSSKSMYIDASIPVNLTIDNVIIDNSNIGDSPVNIIAGSTVNLNLVGSNSLKGGFLCAGLYVPLNATLVIDAADNNQILKVNGGDEAAGIGGTVKREKGTPQAGNITVLNGNIEATGNWFGAGIGGTYNAPNGPTGNGGNIAISGGIVKATGGTFGAGIGGSVGSSGGSITISGGTIEAISYQGAGIGGGSSYGIYSLPAGNGGIIKISGGDITATGGLGAGIGGGDGEAFLPNSISSGSITITGGRVVATASAGSGIGTGRLGSTEDGSVTIKGGSVKATSVNPQPTNGTENVYCNTLTIGSPNIGDDKEISSIMVKGITPSYGLTGAKTMDDGKMYFWLPMSGNGGTDKEVVNVTYNSDNYCFKYARDTSAQTRTLKHSFEVSGSISGLPNVSDVAIDYTINGQSYPPVYTDASGNYKITVDALDLMQISPKKSGYKIFPISTIFSPAAEDLQNKNFQFTPNNYKLHFNSNGGVVGQDTKTVTYGATVGDLPIATKAGYKFTGWNTSEAGTGSDFKKDTEMSIANDVTLHAIYDANDYVVSFDSNGGNAPSKTTMGATYDDPYGELATTSLTGYTFDGWYTTTAYAVKITSGSIVNTLEDHTLYAKWTTNDYVVSFDSNGGDAPSKTTMGATYDDPYGTLATVSRAGYTFDGWYTTTAYAVEISPNTIMKTADDHTLYAKWIPNDYVVSFDANGGNAPSKTTIGATYDDPYGTLATTSRTGYTFDGWYTTGYAVEITSGSIVNIDYDHTLYAKWTANEYTITFNKNGGNSVSPSTKVVTYDSEYGTLATAVKSGYTFEGWFTSQTGGTEIKATDIVDITSDLTLYARWKASDYTVTFDSNGGNDVNPSTLSVTYDEQYGPLPEAKREGYTFLGWYKSPSGRTEIKEDSRVKITNDTTLYARWTANDYILSFDKNGGDEVSHQTKKVTYDNNHGKLPSATRAGYSFTGWHTATTGGVEVKSTDTVKYTNDTTLYAKWSANDYKVTLDVNGGDKLTDNEKNVTKDSTYGNLPTPTKKGHSFQGWYTAKTGGTKITADSKVEITDDQILYAQWKAKAYKVTFNANAKKVKKLSPKSKNVTYNAKLGKLPSPKKTGYKFKGWYTKKNGGTKVTKDSIMKYDKNITLYAKWTKNGKIRKSDVKVHKTPYNSGTVIKKLKKGTKVCILKKVKRGKYTWYKIKAGKKTGYVYSKYVKKV